ncbi:MAG: YdcH family protein [Hoeflea sp.]|uniref:YdcH family protein n=1 Tax=Hoeflea sp. TaxID=1940281 RepID=UPI001DF22F32|nr:YdcH family protein [Hoeflea sp.]MBU4530924.1 YdcH family protein [Alphaproteobacteria bacterium]MBU4542699.1 YdcH family protein [Alphaproteobacteria bacterium]MBU4549374.1 YdcH family protein [Alphaproteobacteria bacterium]MBV1722816.1 YdcH family protein [Hoeflea sp.]MBV1761538.1 YdcH family protein [Hoeflea sp.]
MIARLRALRARHGILQAKIDAETSRPRPDTIRVKILKKMRLKLRDQIALYERLVMGSRRQISS